MYSYWYGIALQNVGRAMGALPLLGWNTLFLMFWVTDSLSHASRASSLREGAKLSPIVWLPYASLSEGGGPRSGSEGVRYPKR